MARIARRIENEFEMAEIAISNTLAEPELYAVLSACGYDTAQLREGLRLCENARASYQRQQGEYGQLQAAYKALETARQQVRDSYMYQVEMARVAFRSDPAIRKKLGLATRRKNGHAGWLEQAKQFYTYALSEPEILRPLIRLGITQEVLEESQRQLATILDHNAARWRQKGAARDATLARNQALAELNAWLRDFLRVARAACKKKPQLLNKLGLTPRAQDRAARPSTTLPIPAPTPTATLAAPEGQPLSAERHNGHTATANREA